MCDTRPLSIETYRWEAEFERVGSRAVRKAQDECRRLGVPNVYSHNGSLYYEHADGSLSTVDPLENDPSA